MTVDTLQTDIRSLALYRETEALYEVLQQPGTGQISDAADIHASPEGESAVFAGTLVDTLDGAPRTRICRVDLSTGDTRVLTFGPNTDRLPKYSPDSQHIAFLSDRHEAGDFQLYLLDPASGAARATPVVKGWVEYLHWSPDGKNILLGVAGHGADVSGRQGAVTSQRQQESALSWMPTVDSGDESFRWRSVWIYELATNQVRQVSDVRSNIWEAVWCGTQALAVVVSPGPGEGLWYTASLHVMEIEGGSSRELYSPQDQIGWPSASPSGRHLAIVDAVCSDRGSVVGDLRLIDVVSGETTRVDTRGINIGHTEWRSDRQLLLAGLRGFETVVALHDVKTGAVTEIWGSDEVSVAGPNIVVSGIGETGQCVMVSEGFKRAPEIAMIHEREYRPVKSFDLGYARLVEVIKDVARVTWQAPDGLEIQGWLLRPCGDGPHPLLMNIHGGPVSHWRPMFLGRMRGVVPLLLIRQGYAVFFPNPRGSSGRGQSFARHVVGDMGGADTYDYLSGLDHLVKEGIADPERLGVTGVSYGGFMTSWLITQDPRFAAAVSVSPVTNQVTEHLISNIPHFVSMFLADHYTHPGGKYFQRSPIMHAHKARTPTLNICGALDRCTPPEEAMQFHHALLENGVKSVLLTYPKEGHGVRKLPAAIDCAARVVAWFEEHLGAEKPHVNP